MWGNLPPGWDGRLSRLNQLDASPRPHGRWTPQPTGSLPCPGYSGALAGASRPYPQLHGITTVSAYGSPLGFSTHHALRVIVNRQFQRGLTVYANYSWSIAMANIESSVNGDNPGRPPDYYNLKIERAISDFDVLHAVKAFFDWQLPVGRGQALGRDASRLLNAFVGGWSASLILNYYSGTPLGFGGSFPLNNGWNGATNRANVGAGKLRADGIRPIPV